MILSPLYLTGKYNFNLDSEIKPYIKADLGYSFNKVQKLSGRSFDKDDKTIENYSEKVNFSNGLYASIGLGLEYKNFTTELAYVHTNAKIKSENESDKYNNNALRLSVGYKFSF